MRTSFTRYRRGASSSATLGPGWLDVFAPALGVVAVGRQRLPPRGMRGQIDFGRAADVAINDILKEAVTGRIFYVTQVAKLVSMKRAFVAEFWPPIPDEFESGLVDEFWTEFSSWTVSAAQGECLLNAGAALSATSPIDIPYLYQTLASDNDFDVYAQLKADTGSGGAIRYSLIKCEPTNGDDRAVCVGVKDNGTAYFVRIDTAADVSGSPPATNLKQWLKANAIVGLVDTDPVSSWSDSSGNGNTVTQATAGNRPTYRTGVINSLPVVRFDGTDDYLQAAAAIVSAAPHTMIACVRPTSVAAGVARFAGGGGYRWGRNGALGRFTTFGVLDYDTMPALYTVNTAHIVSYLFDSSFDLSYYLNSAFVETVAGSADGGGIGNFTVGDGAAAVEPWTGDIAEILLYDTALSATNRQNAEAYLLSKYGLGSGSNEVIAGGLSSGNWGYVRLKRFGARFRAFYAQTTTDPLRESDWIEIDNPIPWTTTGEVRIGLAGFVNAGVTADLRFRFFRNWQSTETR
jgi:hypothetical protein